MASRYYSWCHGQVHYQRRGLGDPLVLVHNVYPGASHAEFSHNLNELARHFTVYAVDLLGFGDSDAPRLKYTSQHYVDLIGDFLRDVVGGPAHVMSAGLSCAYVSDVASREPGLFERIAFVCPRSEPTGLDLPRWAASVRRMLMTAPGLGADYYETVASRHEVTAYLKNCFHNERAVTPELVARLHEYASLPGAVGPYASLLTGYLDRPLLATLPRVTNPLLLIWGRHARPTPVEHSVRLLAMARNCRLRVIEDAGAWPHDEQSAAVDRLVVPFFNGEMAGARPRAETG